MFKKEPYRPNVAIVIINRRGSILWCQRKNNDGWQFPQGGIDKNESPREAILRETKEEVCLESEDLKIIFESKKWFKYDVPKERRPNYFITKNKFRGQIQKWFLAELLSDDSKINLEATQTVEFKTWIWASYWYALGSVVPFKKEVYREALLEMLPYYKNFMIKEED